MRLLLTGHIILPWGKLRNNEIILVESPPSLLQLFMCKMQLYVDVVKLLDAFLESGNSGLNYAH